MTDRPLTDRARKNLAAGATSGPGTDTCVSCFGPKETTRLNSNTCRDCQPVQTLPRLTIHLPPEVMAALTDEATRHGQTPAERVSYLLTRKYR